MAYPHKNIDQMWKEASVDDFLNLGVFPRRDVGQSPGGLLLNVGLVVAQ